MLLRVQGFDGRNRVQKNRKGPSEGSEAAFSGIVGQWQTVVAFSTLKLVALLVSKVYELKLLSSLSRAVADGRGFIE